MKKRKIDPDSWEEPEEDVGNLVEDTELFGQGYLVHPDDEEEYDTDDD